jgi:hypothetical protein
VGSGSWGGSCLPGPAIALLERRQKDRAANVTFNFFMTINLDYNVEKFPHY